MHGWAWFLVCFVSIQVLQCIACHCTFKMSKVLVARKHVWAGDNMTFSQAGISNSDKPRSKQHLHFDPQAHNTNFCTDKQYVSYSHMQSSTIIFLIMIIKIYMYKFLHVTTFENTWYIDVPRETIPYNPLFAIYFKRWTSSTNMVRSFLSYRTYCC